MTQEEHLAAVEAARLEGYAAGLEAGRAGFFAALKAASESQAAVEADLRDQLAQLEDQLRELAS